MKATLPLKLYSVLMRAAAPLLPLYLKRRVKADKEDAARLAERYGKASIPRPDGPLIWIHGASVGETAMAIPIIERLLARYSTLNILITSGTRTSADMLKARLPARAFHQYLPADVPSHIKRFLDHWQPEHCLWLESEIWPNIIRATATRNIPISLLNARFSEKSRKGWQARPRTAKALFGAFKDIFPADQASAEMLSNILDRKIALFGNLKMGAPPLPVDDGKLAELKSQLATRPVWCAASTHKGEDEIILAAHKIILKARPDTLLILVPRHPERADAISELINYHGLKHSHWGQIIDINESIYLIDIIGKMGETYTLSSVVFMGGSLLSHLKGHNPIEPAQMNCAVLSGPHVNSFKDVYSAMETANAVHIFTAPTAENIAKKVTQLLTDDAARLTLSNAALTHSTQENEMIEKLLNSLALTFDV